MESDQVNTDLTTNEDQSFIKPETEEKRNTLDVKGSDIFTSNMEKIAGQLTDGFLSEVQPQLVELREKTKEIIKNQGVLIETIQQENRKFSESAEIEELAKMISVVQSYYMKLKKIKNDMDHLDDRLTKLKKRSLKLKEKRQKKDDNEALRREQELALEQELTAKPAK